MLITIGKTKHTSSTMPPKKKKKTNVDDAPVATPEKSKSPQPPARSRGMRDEGQSPGGTSVLMNLPAGNRTRHIPAAGYRQEVASVQQAASDRACFRSSLDQYKETSDTKSNSSGPCNKGGKGRQKSLMKKRLNEVFQKKGLVASEDQHRAAIGSFVRKTLFRGMKFANLAYLDKTGPVARSVQHHVGMSNKTFDLEWDDTINEKRSACGQSIGKVLIGKFLNERVLYSVGAI
jgi:hypothetical protein